MKLVLSAVLFSLALPVSAQTAFTVNGQTVSSNNVKQYMDYLGEMGVKDPKDREARAQKILITQAAIAQEAAKQKISSSAAYLGKLEDKKTELLVEALVKKNILSKQPTDQELAAYYDSLKSKYDPDQIKLRQIVVPTKEKAQDLIVRIKAGADMAKLAQSESTDGSSATKGGELPYLFIKSFNDPNLVSLLQSLKKGELLNIPYQSPAGYHVIKVEDTKVVPFPKFEDVKQLLTTQLNQRRADDYLKNLVDSAKVAALPPARKSAKKRS